jgi:hypothetical protein
MKTIPKLNEAPRFIRVGSNTFEVFASVRDRLNRGRVIGEVDADDFSIVVEVGVPQKMAETLLHEVLHAIHMMYDLYDENTEEEFTVFTSRGLIMVFMDNPYFFDWLLKNGCLVSAEQNND